MDTLRSSLSPFFSLLLACGGSSRPPTVRLAELDAPAPVRAELERLFGAEAALELEHERDGVREEWEAHAVVPMELELDALGQVRKFEFEVPVGLVPEAVLAAARVRWPSAQLTSAELVVQNGALLWELEASSDVRDELEAYFRPDGSALEEADDPAVEAPVVPEAPAVEEPDGDGNGASTASAAGQGDGTSASSPESTELAEGAECRPGQCGAGLQCAGSEGCDVAWTCQRARPCTRDLRPYCGCNGETIQGSGSCPPAPYVHRGPCP